MQILVRASVYIGSAGTGHTYRHSISGQHSKYSGHLWDQRKLPAVGGAQCREVPLLNMQVIGKMEQ